MCGLRVVILDPQLRAEISERVVIELLTVVRDQYSGYPVPAYDIPPDKTSDVLLRDGG